MDIDDGETSNRPRRTGQRSGALLRSMERQLPGYCYRRRLRLVSGQTGKAAVNADERGDLLCYLVPIAPSGLAIQRAHRSTKAHSGNLHLRSGDTLVVWKLDRLGRTTRQLVDLLEQFEQGGIKLKSLQDGIDPSTTTGKVML